MVVVRHNKDQGQVKECICEELKHVAGKFGYFLRANYVLVIEPKGGLKHHDDRDGKEGKHELFAL